MSSVALGIKAWKLELRLGLLTTLLKPYTTHGG